MFTELIFQETRSATERSCPQTVWRRSYNLSTRAQKYLICLLRVRERRKIDLVSLSSNRGAGGSGGGEHVPHNIF